MMKKLYSICVLCMLIMTLVGCSSNGQTEESQQVNNNLNTLTCGINQDIDNFNPFTNQQIPFVNTINFNCFECLFHYNEDMELEMDLATSYEAVDDVTYVFQLRENVTFHNGEMFTAEDVIYTIECIKDEKNSAWRNSQYANVESMTAIDDHTLEIKLASPQKSFIDNLAYTAIVSKSTTPDELVTTPIGTGAFKFVSWTPNDSIKFEKYEGYWEADKVAMEELILKVIPDSTVALTNLQSETIQYMGGIDIETANVIKSSEELKLIESKYANTIYEFEIGRHNHEALADQEVVRAMFLALDRDLVAESVFGGMASAAKSPLPSAASFYKETDVEGYDIEKAKEVLAATDYADGFEFEVYVLTSDVASQQTLIVWQAELKKIGITMNINICESSVWLDAYLSRSYDMIANYYSMVGTDPSTYCSVIMSALADYQTSDLTELNTLITEGAMGTDDSVRQQTYEKIQELIVEYRPVATYVECPNLNGAVSELSNIMVNGMGHTILKYASFE